MLGKDEFAALENVSRETFADFQTWQNLLNHWNIKINLVSNSTINNFWLRHALDSWQLVSLLPHNISHVIDMGSGAGFPGLALAIAAKNSAHENLSSISLIESNGKKCNFLRTVIRELALPAKVVQMRVEDAVLTALDAEGRRNAITARAFAPLPELLHYSLSLGKVAISKGASGDVSGDKAGGEPIMLFPKGALWAEELAAARAVFDFDCEALESVTQSDARILRIRNVRKRESAQ